MRINKKIIIIFCLVFALSFTLQLGKAIAQTQMETRTAATFSAYNFFYGLPNTLFLTLISSSLTLAGGVFYGTGGAVIAAAGSSIVTARLEASMKQGKAYKRLIDNGWTHAEAYAKTSKDIYARMLGIVFLIGGLGASPALILRFVFKKSYIMRRASLYALLLVALSHCIQGTTPYLLAGYTGVPFFTYGAGITFSISFALLYTGKGKMFKSDARIVNETGTSTEVSENGEKL